MPQSTSRVGKRGTTVIRPLYASVYQGGYEYALLRLAATVALIFTGSGRVALDNILASRGRSVLSYLQRKP